MKNRASFTMIEIVFVIVIIAILSGVAIKKLYYSVDNANIIKLKSQIALIRNAINTKREASILRGQSSSYIDTLDDVLIDTSNQKLFDKILDNSNIISISSRASKSGFWSKSSNLTYSAWVSSSKKVDFSYNSSTGIFDCNVKATNPNSEFCIKLTQ